MGRGWKRIEPDSDTAPVPYPTDVLHSCQTQIVMSGTRPLSAYVAPPSPAVGSNLQPLPPVARVFVPQDVNRAKLFQK